MHTRDGIVRGAVSAQSTGSRTFCKCASEMESSEARLGLNQHVHIQAKMRKRDGIIRGTVSAQSDGSRTYWKCTSTMEMSEVELVHNQQVHALPRNIQARWNHQMRSQCSINKFTYRLEMRKRDANVRGAVSAQSTCSRTCCKRASEMQQSEGRSVLNKRVPVQSGNAQARQNCRGSVGAQSTGSHTYWKCASDVESLEARLVIN